MSDDRVAAPGFDSPNLAAIWEAAEIMTQYAVQGGSVCVSFGPAEALVAARRLRLPEETEALKLALRTVNADLEGAEAERDAARAELKAERDGAAEMIAAARAAEQRVSAFHARSLRLWRFSMLIAGASLTLFAITILMRVST